MYLRNCLYLLFMCYIYTYNTIDVNTLFKIFLFSVKNPENRIKLPFPAKTYIISMRLAIYK